MRIQRRRPSERLFVLFDLRPNELWRVRTLWLHAFFQGGATAYFFTAATVLFLTPANIAVLPEILIGAAIMELVLGECFVQLEARLPESRMLMVLMLGVTLSTLSFFLGLLVLHSAWVILAMFVWARIINYTLHSEFWSLSALLFDVRESKRLFGLVDSGSFLAKVLCYFSVPILVPLIGADELPVLSVIMFAISTLFLRQIVKRHSEHIDRAHHAAVTHSSAHHTSRVQHSKKLVSHFKSLVASRYLKSLGLITFIAIIAITCIDFGFLREIEHKYSEESAVAGFLGLFFGIGKILSSILKGTLTGRMFGKLGLAKSLMILPVSLIVLIAASLIGSEWLAPATVGLWFFSGTMLFVEVWAEGVHVPALALAFQPLTPHERLEGHNLVQGRIEPLGLMIAGILLGVLVHLQLFTASSLAVLLLLPIALWIYAILAMEKEYGAVVDRALRRRYFSGQLFDWDETTSHVLEAKLSSPHPAEVMYALHLIPREGNELFLKHLSSLLHHESPLVRRFTLEHTESMHLEGGALQHVIENVRHLLATEKDQGVLGYAVRCFCQYENEEDFERTKVWLETGSDEVRQGAIVGLMRYQGIDGVLFAGELLLAMIRSTDPKERALAADTIGAIGVRNFFHHLIELLHDSDVRVASLALQAAGKVRHPQLLPHVLSIVLGPDTSSILLSPGSHTLTQFGSQASLAIGKRCHEHDLGARQYRRAVRMLGHIPKTESNQVLVELLEAAYRKRETVPGSRDALLTALSQLHYRAQREPLQRPLEIEFRTISQLEECLEHISAIGIMESSQSTNRRAALIRAIRWELPRALERTLLLFSFLFDEAIVLRVRDNLHYENRDVRANALELLANVLPNDFQKQFLPLFEKGVGVDEIVATQSNQNSAVGTNWNSVIAFLTDSELSIQPWTRAIALCALYEAENDCSPQVLNGFANGPDPLLRDIARSIQSTKYQTYQPITHMILERVMTMKTVEIFSETPENVLVHLANVLEEVHVKPHEIIIRKGDLGDCLFMIVDGAVRVHDGEHTLATLGSREVFGELSLLDPEPRSASVTALEDTYMLRLNQTDFYDALADDIQIARSTMAMLCKRIRDQNAKIANSNGALPGRTPIPIAAGSPARTIEALR